MRVVFPSPLDARWKLTPMARDTDVSERSLASLWRGPLAGGRSLDGWLKDITNDPHVVKALRVANLPKEEST